jgi:hypothetical protein
MTASSLNEPPIPSPGIAPSPRSAFDANAGPREAGLGIEPSVGGVYAHAWSILKADFWTLLLLGLVAWLLGGAIASALSRPEGGQTAVSFLYQLLIGTPIAFGAAYAWLRAVRGIKPEVTDLFVPFQRCYVSAVVAGLLVEIVLIVGFILLVVPGIILAVRLSFVPFLVVDEGLGPTEALFESWRRTAGYSWTIFGAGLLAILIIIVGFILLVVGSIPATMLAYLALASLYAAISARRAAADVSRPAASLLPQS